MLAVASSATAVSFSYQGIAYNTLPDGTAEVGRNDNCAADVVIPESVEYQGKTYRVTSVQDDAFSWHQTLQSVSLPESVTSIGAGAFFNCVSLKKVSIPGKLADIKSGTFGECKMLSEFIIPASVTSIGSAAFENCKSLSRLDIPKGLKTLESRSFCGCEKLEELLLPDELETFEDRMFIGCSSLQKVHLPNWLTTIPYATFEGCKMLNAYSFEEPLTEISERAFTGTGLTEIRLPKKIQTLTVPENVNDIGGGAIAGCTSLKQLIMRPQDVIYITEDRFSEENYNNVELVIPAGMLQQYQEAEGWKNFKTISEQEVTDRQIIATLHVDPFGTVKVNGQVYESGSWAITLPVDKRVKFEIVPDETHLISRAEHQYYGGIDQFSEEVKGGALTIQNVSNGDSFRFIFENGHADIDILQTNKGKVTIHARKNQRYRYMVTPEEGWQINSITWNGEDMTDQMKTNAFIETPIVTANSILQVAVEKSSSAIASSSVSRLKVHAIGDCLYIENVDQGESVGIYGADGTLMKTLTGNGFTLSTTLKRGHVYIIQTKQKTVKILL